MSVANKLSTPQYLHTPQRLPRRPKSKNSTLGPNVRSPDLINRSVNILSEGMAKSTAITNENTKHFEFVTLTTEPTTITTRQTSKTVRKQAMNDYLRKQNRQATTGQVEPVEGTQLKEPSRYKGKFKLDTWSHKTKTKAILARRTKLSEDQDKSTASQLPPSTSFSEALGSVGSGRGTWGSDTLLQILSPNTSLDPFDTLSIKLSPLSDQLLVYYNTKYSMNSIAINAERDFFSFVKTDPALFHSILYLVALHRDFQYSLTDSPACLYHGSEAFRIINDRLENNVVFDDVTIGAVAMLVNKNLNGRYELSKMHMQGLKQMVQTRGGPQNLSGVFRRIVTWSDFCFSNVWNIQPSYPRLPSTLPTSPIPASISSDSEANQLSSSHLFGASSPIIPIISNLRTLTYLLPPSQLASLPTSARMHASNLIYDIEYSLLSINLPSPSLSSFSTALSKCAFTFESVPLRTALHLYLYLSIRLVPSSSELVQAMVLRMRDSLEQIGIMDWWETDEERKLWLLWILWMGVVAARGEERWWFVGEMGRLCSVMEVWDVEDFEERLKKVIWEEEWCGERVGEIWVDMMY